MTMKAVLHLAAGLAAAVVTGCTATISERGVSGVPGEEVWKTEVKLLLGEVAYVDGRDLEIRLDAVGINDAVVTLRSTGSARRETLRTGPGGIVTVSPYEIRLLSTGIDGSAILEVRRAWGQ
jgi:hypothetical protein